MKAFNFKEYQEQARETAQYPIIGHGVIYPILGLVGELGELMTAIETRKRRDGSREGIMKEAGDVLWYIANLAYELEVEIKEVQVPEEFKVTDYMLDRTIMAYAEHAKKVFRDHHGLFTRYEEEEHISKILHSYCAFLYAWRLDIEEVARMNIEKLRDRKERGVIQGSGDNR
ncbi:MAG TPA: nucleoside triphosphate pyrophosphohydrolase family protein [Ignavibacteriales bacterium]|nr:nucleoside triphosphate pyrophosphohydrolase family protein [Ignavibacteriales bacterium]